MTFTQQQYKGMAVKFRGEEVCVREDLHGPRFILSRAVGLSVEEAQKISDPSHRAVERILRSTSIIAQPTLRVI